jgi:hypothetical protein
VPSTSLIHDHAWALAAAILEIVRPCLREEEQRDAFEMFLTASKGVLEKFAEASSRQTKRLCKPSHN